MKHVHLLGLQLGEDNAEGPGMCAVVQGGKAGV